MKLNNKVIIVTGCEGFIGSNITKFLSKKLVSFSYIGCGSLNSREKLLNINDLKLLDYWNKTELFKNLDKFDTSQLVAIIHMGACSSTREWDGHYLIENNTRFTNKLIDYCLKNKIRMINASSASVYGLSGKNNKNKEENLQPINMYAYSKLLSDNYLSLNYTKQNLITSLRFFNVFGINEDHKFGMSSPIHSFNEQSFQFSSIKIFKEESNDSLFTRDFVPVTDICELIYQILFRKDFGGIFDAGSAKPISFQNVAKYIVDWWINKGKLIELKEVPFPKDLIGSYQKFTCADMNYLKNSDILFNSEEVKKAIYSFLDKKNQNRISTSSNLE